MAVHNLTSLKSELYYCKASPGNQAMIDDASLQEREGFGTGIDPMELPEVLSFIAKHGKVWLQYSIEDNKAVPTGVAEFIQLTEVLKFKPKEIKTEFDINVSPLAVIMGNQERVFSDARKFAEDKDITYHHGIAMSRRGQGYGTLLLRYALDHTDDIRNRLISSYIDAAKVVDGKPEPAANESSYTVHMKEGFVLVGVVNPPVYEGNITYYSVMRPSDTKPFKYGTERKMLKFDNPNVTKTMDNVRELVSSHFAGVAYDKKSHEMLFKRLA